MCGDILNESALSLAFRVDEFVGDETQKHKFLKVLSVEICNYFCINRAKLCHKGKSGQKTLN